MDPFTQNTPTKLYTKRPTIIWRNNHYYQMVTETNDLKKCQFCLSLALVQLLAVFLSSIINKSKEAEIAYFTIISLTELINLIFLHWLTHSKATSVESSIGIIGNTMVRCFSIDDGYVENNLISPVFLWLTIAKWHRRLYDCDLVGPWHHGIGVAYNSSNWNVETVYLCDVLPEWM